MFTSLSNVDVKSSINDYEAEILKMKSDLDNLQIKTFSGPDFAIEVLHRLTKEEEKFRNDWHLGAPCPNTLLQSDAASVEHVTDKEKMLNLQQKKIAALDAANRRLLEELNKISDF